VKKRSMVGLIVHLGDKIVASGQPGWEVCGLEQGDYGTSVVIRRRGLFGERRMRLNFPNGTEGDTL
jgi:hypothetical protein